MKDPIEFLSDKINKRRPRKIIEMETERPGSYIHFLYEYANAIHILVKDKLKKSKKLLQILKHE